MTDFSNFGLAQPIIAAVAEQGYTTPTPIQRQAIPPLVAGRDLLGIAQTGTGKTAAFALPALDWLCRNKAPTPRGATRVLVLAPTRELAGQIATSFTAYAGRLSIKVKTAFGGVPVNRHIREMSDGVDVLVATPGRLLDLVDQKALRLDRVEVLVLDEADQMLDLGFVHALRRILALVPAKRQTVLFSATMPKAIGDLAKGHLTDPETVTVTPVASTAERVEQRVIFVSTAAKPELLIKTLREEPIDRALVFSRTKHGADRIVRRLKASGLEAAAIHGNKSQPQRERALAAFRSGAMRILVATDIAARGIDIPGVSHVVNFDTPNVPEQYVHRIGRTARAGAEGLAISFVADDERAYLRDIEKLIRTKIPAQTHQPPSGGAATPEPKPDAPPAKTASGAPAKKGPNGPAGPKRRRRRKPRAGDRAVRAA